MRYYLTILFIDIQKKYSAERISFDETFSTGSQERKRQQG